MSSLNVAHCPRDIWLTIFSLALPPSELFKQRHFALTALRLVCFHWDAVIISNPIFWSAVEIYIPSQYIPRHVLTLWLERSTDAALDISLKDTPPLSWTPSEISRRTELLSTIQPYTSHCRSLQLDVSAGFLPAFRNFRFSDAHRLEYFCINMKGSAGDDVHQNMIHQLSSLPKLHHLSCTTNYNFFTTSLLQHASVPWFSHLRNVEVSCPISSDEMIELLTQCTSAHSITLNYVRPSSSPSTTPSPPESNSLIDLPSLRILNITLHPNVYQTLYRNFSFPNLQILKIQGPDISDLSFTLNHLSPSLQILKFHIQLYRRMRAQLSAFLKHENIHNLPIFEIECRENQIWEEYEGWGDSNGNDDPVTSSKVFCELIDELNRQLENSGVPIDGNYSRGDKLIKYDEEHLDLCQGCFIGWVDEGMYMKYWEEFGCLRDRNVFMIQPFLFSSRNSIPV